MSVGFCMEYDVIFRGGREDIAQMAEIAKTLVYDTSLRQYIVQEVEATLEDGEDVLMVRLSNSDDDATHGIFEDFLDAVDQGCPALTIALSALYVDTEYGEGDILSMFCSPAGKSTLNMKAFYGLDAHFDPMPDEDWVPYGWRHPKELPPAATAEGVLSFLGDWGAEERSAVEEALLGGTLLKALPALQPNPQKEKQPVFSKEGETIRFSLSAPVNLADAAQYLDLTLAPYAQTYPDSYAALCHTMREKRLLLHLELESHSNPNTAWSYPDSSTWHFLISSDGRKLISRFTWCATYGFSSYNGLPAEVPVEEIYEAVTGASLDDLDERENFAAQWALHTYAARHDAPLPLVRCKTDWEMEMEEWGDDEDWDEEEDEEEDEALAYAQDHREALLPLFAQAQRASAPIPAHDQPQSFDSRFAGKTFCLGGDVAGWTGRELRETITKFGGTVADTLTPQADYFVYGTGVGEPFPQALQQGVLFLPVEYLQDMMA